MGKKNKKILIVDNDRELVQMLALIISKTGYEVSYSTSSGKGMELVAQLKPDLLILDLAMPGMTGEEVLKLLSEIGLDKKPIILISGDHNWLKTIKIKDNQRKFFKPFDNQKLLAAIKELLK